MANLSRVLESYEYNTGLDFISGVLRLLIDDFGNADGKDRFETSFKQIMKYEIQIYLLQTIFSKIGTLKRCGIHWDELGNSKGTADLEYERAEDAKAALKEFNGI